MNCISEFVKKEKIDETAPFWIDVFAVNQHEANVPLTQIASAIASASRTVLCVEENHKTTKS